MILLSNFVADLYYPPCIDRMDGGFPSEFSGVSSENSMNRRIASIGVSVGLAALTLSVFSAAQSAGPESAVRRFLKAIQTGDGDGAQSVITSSLSTRESQWLVFTTRNLASAPMRVKGKERSGNITLVVTDHDVVINTPGGAIPQVVTRYWILRRDSGQWRVDPLRTYQYLGQSRFLGR